MKNLRKIIGLFLTIFIAGIAVTVITVKTTLSKKELPIQTSEKQKDSITLVKAKKIKSSTGVSGYH